MKKIEEKFEERCPKCRGFSIKWEGDGYRCLWRDCRHFWTNLEGGPKKYNDIKNVWLRLSFSPGATAP